ncbi:hypothetical protein F66182_10861 [Fusarium sp. NRRL 66182]|nr:hypothetical protein F66182_10861 [Fusarium sp. NRRL 66182]
MTFLFATLFLLLITVFFLLRMTVIDLKDYTVSIFASAGSLLVSAFSSTPGRHSVVPKPLLPIIPHYSTLGNTMALCERKWTKMGDLIRKPDPGIFGSKAKDSVTAFRDDYYTQFVGLVNHFTGSCRHRLALQAGTLEQVFAEALQNRTRLKQKSTKVSVEHFPEIRDTACRAAKQLQGDQAEQLRNAHTLQEDQDKETHDLINNQGQIADLADGACALLKVANQDFDIMHKLIEDDVDMLTSTKALLREFVVNANKVSGPEMAKVLERHMLDHGQEWLDLTSRYYGASSSE